MYLLSKCPEGQKDIKSRYYGIETSPKQVVGKAWKKIFQNIQHIS